MFADLSPYMRNLARHQDRVSWIQNMMNRPRALQMRSILKDILLNPNVCVSWHTLLPPDQKGLVLLR